MRHAAFSVIASFVLPFAGLSAQAQQYPSKPIQLVVPFAAGGNLDVVTRPLAQELSKRFGQPVYVDIKPGASGILGTQKVAKAAPDGYTLLMSATILVTTPTIMSNVTSYDPVNDFRGISMLGIVPQVLIVNPSLPVKNIPELLQLAKSQPGKLNYGSGGTGSSSHLATELFARQAGISLKRIPYKSSAPALTDLIGGQTSMMFDNLSTAIPHIKSGRLKALAVTTAARSPLLPDVPTASDSMPGYVAAQFNGIFAPAKAPKEIIARLHAEMLKFVELPAMQSLYAQQGVILMASPSPEQFDEYVKAEYVRWTKVIKEAGIKEE